jgi:hypothetical protein
MLQADFELVEKCEVVRIDRIKDEIKEINSSLKNVDAHNRMILTAALGKKRGELDEAEKALAALRDSQKTSEQRARERASIQEPINKAVMDRPSSPYQGGSLQDQIAEIQLLDKAIAAADPGQDVSAMKQRVARLRGMVALKASMTAPRRVGRGGELL